MLSARWGKPKQSKIAVAIGLDCRFNLFLKFLQSREKLGVAARLLLACLDLLSDVTDLLYRHRNFTQSRRNPGGQLKLPHQSVLRCFHARIQLDRQRLRAAFAVGCELHSIFTRHRQRAGWSPERTANALRQRVMKVPHESVHSRPGQKRLRVDRKSTRLNSSHGY